MTEPILVVTGPTASGKSALAIELAEKAGAELVSMDSMAVYRRMDIGTAKPSAAERARVPHHLVDVVGPHEPFDTATWCRLAQGVVDRAGATPLIFVGGTPLYLMAFFKGMLEGPSADPELRARLEEAEDSEPGCLHRELSARDPVAAARIHVHDRKRLVRALEVLERTGRPISEQQDTFHADGWRVPCRVLWLDRDRDDLRERVKVRTRAMLDRGLVDETRSIRDDVGFSPSAAAAIGYALFSSSRHVIAGPDAAIGLLAGSAILPLSGGDPARMVQLAAVLSLLSGVVLLLAARLKLGIIADLLSRPVLIGYLNGASLVLIATQLGKMFGIKLESVRWEDLGDAKQRIKAVGQF